MKDDLEFVRQLGHALLVRLQEVTHSVRIGEWSAAQTPASPLPLTSTTALASASTRAPTCLSQFLTGHWLLISLPKDIHLLGQSWRVFKRQSSRTTCFTGVGTEAQSLERRFRQLPGVRQSPGPTTPGTALMPLSRTGVSWTRSKRHCPWGHILHSSLLGSLCPPLLHAATTATPHLHPQP